jgi:hypothetical protein
MRRQFLTLCALLVVLEAPGHEGLSLARRVSVQPNHPR